MYCLVIYKTLFAHHSHLSDLPESLTGFAENVVILKLSQNIWILNTRNATMPQHYEPFKSQKDPFGCFAFQFQTHVWSGFCFRSFPSPLFYWIKHQPNYRTDLFTFFVIVFDRDAATPTGNSIKQRHWTQKITLTGLYAETKPGLCLKHNINIFWPPLSYINLNLKAGKHVCMLLQHRTSVSFHAFEKQQMKITITQIAV